VDLKILIKLNNFIVVTLLSAGLFFAKSALAQSEQDVGWLIYPQSAFSPSVEVTYTHSKTHLGIWRLKSADNKLLAEMTQPVLPDGYVMNFGNCLISGLQRDDVIAFVKHREGVEWSSNVHRLWLVAPVSRKFQPAKTDNVKCRNEGFGL